jgi:hypothetical protein
VLTRDKLSKMRHVEDPSCLFCSNGESAHHLFFECYVAKVMWRNLSEYLGEGDWGDFESLASFWLCSKKFKILNIHTTAILWALWKKMRNYLCFQVNQWYEMHVVFCRCAKILRRWCIMQKEVEEVAKE